MTGGKPASMARMAMSASRSTPSARVCCAWLSIRHRLLTDISPYSVATSSPATRRSLQRCPAAAAPSTSKPSVRVCVRGARRLCLGRRTLSDKQAELGQIKVLLREPWEEGFVEGEVSYQDLRRAQSDSALGK